MAPRPDVSEERKAEIVEAATRVFSRKGFSGARMDDIVTESGLSKGLLYWYFKSKDAIIVAIMERLLKPEMDRIRQLASAGGSARERLMGFAEYTIKEIETMGRILPITFEYYSLAFRNKTVRKAFQGFFAVFLDGVAQVISQGAAAGEFHEVDPRAGALTIGAAVEGSMLLWLFDRQVVRLGAQIRTAVGLAVRGMEAPQQTAGPAADGRAV
jgi:AcrR family transcriptional regulator